MLSRRCAFSTARLRVAEWHSMWPEGDGGATGAGAGAAGAGAEPLAATVCRVLTAKTTAALPPAWQGEYSLERAVGWIKERDAEKESATLLVEASPACTGAAKWTGVGLLILFEMPNDLGVGASELRLGYVLAEDSWGKGLASELVSGLVTWCRARDAADAIGSIAGGVAKSNPASARVLEKAGFSPSDREDEGSEEETMYRLML